MRLGSNFFVRSEYKMSEVTSVGFLIKFWQSFRWFANFIAAALDPARIPLCALQLCPSLVHPF